MADDKPVFLITGASTGIGAATARHAAEAGCRPVLAARSEDKLRALDEYGRIDVAFANAGFGGPRGFEKYEPDFMREMVLTNVLGVAYTIKATMPALRRSKGHLLLTSSVAGRRALPGSLYSATKFAVTAMGEAARQDLNDSGVRTTLIEPGMVDTPFFDDPIRMKDPLQPDDIARAIMFAVQQPPHVDVNEVLVRPTNQPS